jgi:cysteine desulfurase/selenocysteine lyase
VEVLSKENIDIEKIRAQFPILQKSINGKPLVYFDSGATSQKPIQVIDAINAYYKNQNSNIHRGVHTLSSEITVAYENARTTIQKYINAKRAHEIIFTSGTTDSINLVAHSFGKKYITAGDEIIISAMEHHSNILPWQLLCEEKNAVLKIIPVSESGELLLDEYKKLLNAKTKLVAATHVSNTLGTINPVKKIIEMAHQFNAAVLIDGAQAIPHTKVDVQNIDADFYCFSGHKAYGPTGVGILYGKEKWLNEMPPYKVGGGTIKTVSFSKTVYADLPLKFEAGTPHIAGGIGLAAAINYINAIGIENINSHEHEILTYATERLLSINGLKIIGNAKNKAGVISFVVNDLHPLDIGTILDKYGIAVRTGHHCTQPLMEHYCVPGTVRVSLAVYNTKEEIDSLIEALNKAIKMLQ